MKNFSIALVYIFVAILTACSFSADFIITNSTEHNISVSYNIHNGPCEKTSPPAIKELNAINRNKIEWQKLSSSKYTCDPISNTISLIIPSQKAILVWEEYNYFEHKKMDGYPEAYYTSLSMNISGPDGVISITGFQVMRAFKMLEPNQYVLSY